jgi:hypothetical protein
MQSLLTIVILSTVFTSVGIESWKNISINFQLALLEILSFATSHYATGMQLVVVCN